MQTILVAGSVTAREYQPVRSELIKAGAKVRVVRIDNLELYPLFGGDLGEVVEDIPREKVTHGDWYEALFEELLARKSVYGGVRSLVVSEADFQSTTGDTIRYLREYLASIKMSQFDFWVVRESGTVEFMGN